MTYSDYRRVARENLRDNWGTSILVGAIAALLGGLIIGSTFFPQFNFRIEGQDVSSISDVLNLFSAGAVSAFGLGSALGLAQFIIGGVIQLGYAQYLLNQYNRSHFDINNLFSKFEHFAQGFLQSFLRGLYIFLWGLLFIIPGIIKSYAYAMTPFIMAENPDMTANEAITASCELMDGHKSELFMLDLTFIGWDLLAALTMNLGYLALNPYKNAAYAAFYKDITAPKTNSSTYYDAQY